MTVPRALAVSLALLLCSQRGLECFAQGVAKTIGSVPARLLFMEGIPKDSSIQVFTNLTEFLDLGGDARLKVPLTGATTVSSSVLLMNSDAKTTAGDTQVYYTCTTVPRIWNYSQDATIDATVAPEVSFAETGATNTTVVAHFRLVDCSKPATKFAVGEVVLGNAFFGSSFDSNQFHFRVQESAIESTLAQPCAMRLKLTRATLSEIFASCSVKFKTVNATSLFAGSAITSNNQDMSAVQVQVKDSVCQYDCGVAATQLPSLYSASIPSLSQCYACNTALLGACPDAYPYTTATECCALRNCTSKAVTPKVPELISWNLATDGMSALQREYVLYESGDCSNRASVTSTCCLITCRDCYLALDVQSLFLEIATSANRTAGELVLNGRGALTIAVAAPNGCSVESVVDKIRIPVSSITTTVWGLALSLTLQLTHRKQLRMSPRVSDAVQGSGLRFDRFRGGYSSAGHYADGTIAFSGVVQPTLASLDMDLQGGISFEVAASARFLDSATSVRVGVSSAVLIKVNSSARPMSLFPAKPSAALARSAFSTGDCRLPHFMEYEMATVVDQSQVLYGSTLVDRSADGDAAKNVTTTNAAVSQASGCVAAAYAARFNLSVQKIAVQALVNDTVRKARLRRALPRALDCMDLDPAMISILAISTSDGTVELELAAPPSVQATLRDATRFEDAMRARSRTDKFKRAMSTAIALPVNAYCGTGQWGVTCDQECTNQGCNAVHLYCVRAKCDAVTGSILMCDACAATKWGATCDATCAPPAGCAAASCDPKSGAATECLGCESGYWGPLCSRKCAASAACRYPRCNQASGLVESCASCGTGYYGKACNDSCPLTAGCETATCDQVSGATISCPTCAKNWYGPKCEYSAAARVGLSVLIVLVTILGSLVIAS
ncbi:hypothetical protein PybrP1_004899 [[Pythium] brassicae (nom. inval.)]|nr:hypothetical protein PybrP1_004899 [[Pythium] brassicae (nom. inval.)]